MAPAVSVTTTSSMEALQNGPRSKLISVVLCSLTSGLRRNMLYSSITICAKTPFLREVSYWLAVKNDKVIQAQATNLLMLKFCVFLSLNRNFLLCRGRNILISNSADDIFLLIPKAKICVNIVDRYHVVRVKTERNLETSLEYPRHPIVSYF